jgi:pimeloyl-ACP methyl ester carboxylesterase
MGHESVAVQLPSSSGDLSQAGTLADDTAVVEAAVAAIPGPVTVVAHSYGGIPATQAELPERASVIFVTAYVPNPGESLVTSHKSDGPRNAEMRPDDGVLVFIPENARDVFYNDLDEAAAAAATTRLEPQKLKSVVTPVDRASWHSRRTSYIVCTEDHSIPPEAQRTFASRTGATRELPSSHSPMLSRPVDLARLLVELE